MPDLYWLETDPRVLGAPFYAMERVQGDVPVQWDGTLAPELRARIGREFIAGQATIHQVDWRGELGFFETPADPSDAAFVQIGRWEALCSRSARVEIPLLRYALGWLRANVACSDRLALCHGDYRIGNFIVRDGSIVAVLDWELAHISDPVEDVAYSGLPLFRGRTQLLSQLLSADEYLALYEEHSGLRVDPAALRFWTVLGLVKAAAVHVAAARAFEDGRTGDLRLAALGHQVHFVLRLLAAELRA